MKRQELGITVQANIPKSQFSIFYMYWETFRIPARATFKNPNFNLDVNWEKFGSTASVQD